MFAMSGSRHLARAFLTFSGNPAPAGGILQVELSGNTAAVFRLFDDKGRAVRIEKLAARTPVSLNGIGAGLYTYSIENETFMRFGKLIVL